MSVLTYRPVFLIYLYFIGTPEAYALIKNDTVTTSRLYNMARYIYAIFAIEQRDFQEVYHILRRRIGRHEFMADLWFLRFYSTFKQGTVITILIFLTYPGNKKKSVKLFANVNVFFYNCSFLFF